MNNINNTEYALLKLINNNSGRTLNLTYCSLSQTEMGEYLGMRRRDVSRLVCNLTNRGYIVPRVGKVRRYALTNRGQGVLDRLDNQ